MSDGEDFRDMRRDVGAMAQDVAVIKAAIGRFDDHEERIHKLEGKTGNNTLIARAAVGLSVILIGSAFTVLGSLFLSTLE